tara:strand:+ start:1574 stop:1828 length:255 start_codon:yes stop_codon:yes gene_type:complete
MIKIFFFGRLRETLNASSIEISDLSELATVDKVRIHLSKSYGSIWEEALNQSNIVISVNQVVVSADTAIQDGDELAFFPPMTGG